MSSVRRLLPALGCAAAVVVCGLASRPFAAMGICDDWSYLHTAQRAAATGRLVYSGWAPAMQAWQAYVGAAFLRVFGGSYTSVRMSTLVTAAVLAVVLQRVLVRAGVTQRSAALGTLALVVSPLYLMLSVTFMTDIASLFAVVVCLYGCLRALQAATDGAAVGWVGFAVAANVVVGSTRQIAWLGVLVMVPCTLWLLRRRQVVLLAGAAINALGAAAVVVSLHWLARQPYAVQERLLGQSYSLLPMVQQYFSLALDAPFLLLPVVLLFLPEVRRARRVPLAVAAGVAGAYLARSVLSHGGHPLFVLEPAQGDWVTVCGFFDDAVLHGHPPAVMHVWMRLVLTALTQGGVIGLVCSWRGEARGERADGVSWGQLGVLLGPFTVAYLGLLASRASTVPLFDRYLLPLLVVGLVCLLRWYQERVSVNLPRVLGVLVAGLAVFSVTGTQNLFALYRARVAMVAELRAAGVPDTAVDNGWEYNSAVELREAGYVDDDRIENPAGAYVAVPEGDGHSCKPFGWHEVYPHVHPQYGVSLTPDACGGPAPFAPVNYARWPWLSPGTLYVVRYTPQP